MRMRALRDSQGSFGYSRTSQGAALSPNDRPERTGEDETRARGPERVNQRAIAACVLVALAAIVAIAAASAGGETGVILSSIAMSSFLLAGLSVVSLVGGPRTLFNLRLGPGVIGYASIAFGVATMTALNDKFISAIVNVAAINSSLLIISGGFLVLVLGYMQRSASYPLSHAVDTVMRQASKMRSPIQRGTLALYVVFLAGLTADGIKIAVAGQFGYLGDATLVTIASATWYSQPLEIASNLKLAAIFGLSLGAFKEWPARRALSLIPALVIAVPLSLATGMKESFVDIVVAVLIAYVFARRRVRLMPVFLAVVMFVVVVTPFVTQLRLDVRGSEVLGVDEALERVLSQAQAEDGYFEDVDAVDSGLQVLSRLRLVDNLVVIRENTPEFIEYRQITDILVAPFQGIIPRAVWPEKPIRLAGYDFYKIYYQGQGESSSAITLQGSLYMHGGIGVFLLGMFMVGIALRAIDDGLKAQTNPHGALMIVLIAPLVVKQEMDVPGFLAGIPIIILTWVMCTWLVFRPADGDPPPVHLNSVQGYEVRSVFGGPRR